MANKYGNYGKIRPGILLTFGLVGTISYLVHYTARMTTPKKPAPITMPVNQKELAVLLGNRCASIGDDVHAIMHYRQALARDDSFAEAHFQLSCVFARQGKKERAQFHYDRACLLNPALAQLRQLVEQPGLSQHVQANRAANVSVRERKVATRTLGAAKVGSKKIKSLKDHKAPFLSQRVMALLIDKHKK